VRCAEQRAVMLDGPGVSRRAIRAQGLRLCRPDKPQVTPSRRGGLTHLRLMSLSPSFVRTIRRGVEDLVGGLRPDDGFGVVVPVGDPGADRVFEFFVAARAASEPFR